MSERNYTGKPYLIQMSYTGGLSDDHIISLYDLSRAMLGFERSLALTTHFALNSSEVITQVPSLRGAQILCAPPEAGSYKVAAIIAATGAATFSLGSLKSDNPLGHLVYSLYEIAVHEATGQTVDYDKSLREIYEKGVREGSEGIIMPKKSQIESLVEKIEPSISELHRPMVGSETASQLKISPVNGEYLEEAGSEIVLNSASYDRLRYRELDNRITSIQGKVSSFNMNTFNGRIVTSNDARPIPFFLTPAGRTVEGVKLIAESLAANITDRKSNSSIIVFDVRRASTRTGRTVKLSVVKVRKIRYDENEILRNFSL
ncbi:hypothetical protein SAMN04488041_103398 [Sulfitobacter pontiacus]|uniref:Uncharacterized protein n=1 Tax=Sulfitobacter pontiacus TaxID=60137 RepID=A0A1H2WVQ5_9RHOB|nr:MULTISPECIES: hypothetical protein [Sulfitobacter]QPO09865.1 hypothetical protein IT972_06430 [Sulfitobacter sp. B30-2]SDW84645.1 hypothetical protein SAMN04488041_103398 [Sulfitobacter pontiacus]